MKFLSLKIKIKNVTFHIFKWLPKKEVYLKNLNLIIKSTWIILKKELIIQIEHILPVIPIEKDN